eukprot:5646682-Pleurochrysis_carterae.AAC.1
MHDLGRGGSRNDQLRSPGSWPVDIVPRTLVCFLPRASVDKYPASSRVRVDHMRRGGTMAAMRLRSATTMLRAAATSTASISAAPGGRAGLLPCRAIWLRAARFPLARQAHGFQS